ncbi:MAG: SDR family oxidoreductase [Burkholderiaceae bacterium]
MTDSVVLITGGSRGIGAATAVSAAQAGFDVVISYQHAQGAARQVCEQVEAHGRQALAVPADVAIETDVIDLFKAVDQHFGRLDALVNNAGIVAPAMPFEQYSAERVSQLLAVNVFGAFMVAREAVRRLSTRHGGSGGAIVNVSSAASRLGAPDEYIDYAATKGAIDSMTLGLAKELGSQGVRVNAVRPGLIETDIHASGGRPDRVAQMGPGLPMGRGGTAQEVADAIVFLISPAASYVSGTLMDIAGGR